MPFTGIAPRGARYWRSRETTAEDEMVRKSLLCALLMLLPIAATAEAYKCKRPDGKISFQDQPCEPGSTGAPMILQDPSPTYDPPAPKAPSAPERAGKRDKVAPQEKANNQALKDRNSELEANNKALEAKNRQLACNSARRSLGALRTQLPAYQLDEHGNRKFVEDENRAAEIAAAQKRADEACN
jgi:hypothetical protein